MNKLLIIILKILAYVSFLPALIFVLIYVGFSNLLRKLDSEYDARIEAEIEAYKRWQVADIANAKNGIANEINPNNQ